jgi:sirohydrochlorin ferrochelatase
MTGILILAHGSRQKETENTLLKILELVKAELKSDLIQHAFLQFSNNNLEKGLKRLIDQGATQIQVIPYFLFDGVHILEDIPAEIKEFLKVYPDVKIDFGQTLGADQRLAQILVDRVRILNGED